MKSYFGKVEAIEGLLLGDVTSITSSRFETKKQVSDWIYAILKDNKEVNKKVQANIFSCDKRPEINKDYSISS